jgi:hypothetical protein
VAPEARSLKSAKTCLTSWVERIYPSSSSFYSCISTFSVFRSFSFAIVPVPDVPTMYLKRGFYMCQLYVLLNSKGFRFTHMCAPLFLSSSKLLTSEAKKKGNRVVTTQTSW